MFNLYIRMFTFVTFYKNEIVSLQFFFLILKNSAYEVFTLLLP
jgi:hypothetical protein